MQHKNLKIAIYSGNIPSTTFIENLIEGLAQVGFEIYLFGKQTKEISYKGNVKIIPTPVSNLKLVLFVIRESLVLFFKNSKLLFKSLKEIWNRKRKFKTFLKEAGVLLPMINHKPDIFHIQWAKTVHQFPEIFELLDCKFALSLRGAHINYSPLTDLKLAESYKKYFPAIDGFHAVSETIGIESHKYGADKKKIKVIHSSVKDELLQKKSELYKEGQSLEIISIGRFHWKKGYHYALDAMKVLKDEGINFSYSIIAQDEIPEEILFMIDDYGLEDKIKILQGLSYDKLIEKLQHSHILLLPSVEEGIANVVLEAMAVGVPVITSDCGGMDEVIRDKVNGYIVPVRNPNKIIEKIKEFISTNYDFKNKTVETAREKIKKEFSRDEQIQDFYNFYYSLIQ